MSLIIESEYIISKERYILPEIELDPWGFHPGLADPVKIDPDPTLEHKPDPTIKKSRIRPSG